MSLMVLLSAVPQQLSKYKWPVRADEILNDAMTLIKHREPA